jgi:hypothetical protein
MGRNIFRQETQIRKSDLYDDTIAPSEANYETNPASIEADLNSLRSMASNLLDVQAGNWWDDLNVPTALDTGAKRGVNDLNTDLHANERKRILRRRQVVGADIAVPAAVAADGVLTAASQPSDGDTVVIGTKTYTFQTTLTDVDGNVHISAVDASGSLDNLIAAITLGAGAGTAYANSMTLHPTATAAAGAGDTMDATAKEAGTAGNSIATTTPIAVGGLSWAAATLTGGAGDVVILDAAGELPGNLIAAVGAVTTLGTVVAYDAAFGTASLDEVAGGDALTPKNLCKVSDSATGDVIVDASGREIHALLQSESNTDGHTIVVTTPSRVQLSFVVHNATNDNLILADGAYIGGQTIDYSPIERYAFEDIPEHAWLGDDFVDAGAATTTRQGVYDNQGTTPVDTVSNSTLDLGTGLFWKIRDDASADLLALTDGSAGGTTDFTIGADVDTYQNKAVDVDFDNGITVDETGTAINIGVTTAQIDAAATLSIKATGAASDLLLEGGREVLFDDANLGGSAWSGASVQLSDTVAEWTQYIANFGDGTSLIDAINQAYSSSVVRTIVWSVVTVAANADVDLSGPANDNNLDTNLGSLATGTFTTDYDFFWNGQILRPGADAAANHDIYPGTALANGQIKLEFKAKVGDQLLVIKYV